MTMPPEKLERQIAMSTEAGREGLAVWERVMRTMSGEQKIIKAFELTEMTRQLMRAGIRDMNPEATEDEIDELYLERLFQYHGMSLAEIRLNHRKQLDAREQSVRESLATTQ